MVSGIKHAHASYARQPLDGFIFFAGSESTYRLFFNFGVAKAHSLKILLLTPCRTGDVFKPRDKMKNSRQLIAAGCLIVIRSAISVVFVNGSIAFSSSDPAFAESRALPSPAGVDYRE